LGLMEAFSQTFLENLKAAYRTPYTGAHLIVHALGDKPCRLEHDLKAGVHILADDTIQRIRSGTTYRDLKSPKEWCILGNLPQRKTEICQEARFAMIQTSENVLDSNLQQLESYAATFVEALQRRCRTIPIDGGSK